MTDTLKSINTNELRDYADRISNPYSQLILDAASELDATRTERNILRAALTPPAAVEDGWQPIETAPRDGTQILACAQISEHLTAAIISSQGHLPDLSIVKWDDREKDFIAMADGYMSIKSQGDNGTTYHEPYVTHWMPLPIPPRRTEGDWPMTREELIEVMARAIEPNMPVQVKYWQEGKIQRAEVVWPGSPEYVSPVPAAMAALAAIEAAGVRLVPAEATLEMRDKGFLGGLAALGTPAQDTYGGIFRAMIAASPYNTKETR